MKTADSTLQSFVFGDRCLLINNSAFKNCTGLTSITIPESTNGIKQTSIPQEAFYGCSNLASINFADSITTIEDYAFYNCSKLYLEDIFIADAIGAYAFSGCVSLPPVLELRAKSISAYAFNQCTQLQRIWLRSTVTTIDAKVESDKHAGPFANCPSYVTIYAEVASKPSSWNEYFNYTGESVNSKLKVFWNIQSKPEVSLDIIWDADARIITFEDSQGEEKGYEYTEITKSLVIY